MVFVAGHWEAWQQQGDFLDRFMGRPPIQLVRLIESDVIKIIQVYAPGWEKMFSPIAVRTLSDATSGNIRRVMTVLYDLYSEPVTRDGSITPQAVTSAASRRLQRGTGDEILPAIEAAARAKGALLERDITLGEQMVNAILSVSGEMRLLVYIAHARDEGSLLTKGESFADLVRSTRLQAPRTRGLFIALGAVNLEHLKTLDAARIEMDVINGEQENISEEVARLVVTAISEPMSEPVQGRVVTHDNSVSELREELTLLRRALLERAESQVSRSVEVFAEDTRSDAVRQSIAPDSEDIVQQRGDLKVRETYARLLDDVRQPDRYLYRMILNNPLHVAYLLLGMSMLLFSELLGRSFAEILNARDQTTTLFTIMIVTFALGFIYIFLMRMVRIYIALDRFRQFRIDIFDRLVEMGESPSMLKKIRSIMERALDRVGPREGIYEFEREIKKATSIPPWVKAEIITDYEGKL
jgi:hypothetical protein